MDSDRLLFVLIFALAMGCELHISEPAPSRGVYYLENLTEDRLVVEAESPWSDPLQLTNSEVEAGETRELYSRVNDASHAPSNMFGQLTIHRETVSDETLVYSGIDNAHWVLEPGGEGGDGKPRVHYTLTIPVPSNP